MLKDCVTRFNQLYADEEACIALIHKLRWPTGFLCSRCGHTASYIITTRRLPLFECSSCGCQTSLTSGTVMHKSRTALRKWLLTMYIVATNERSINAVSLSNLLQVTYKTAWNMLNKVREVISSADRKTLLSGTVVAKHEIYMKQLIPLEDRLQQEKSAIFARTASENQPTYFKIKLLERQCTARKDLSTHDIDQFASKHVSANLTSFECNKRFVSPYHCKDPLTLAARRVFRWLNDTFHGLGETYSQAYLDEFCFRLNYPTTGSRCPFEYLLQLSLYAITIEEPTNYYKPPAPKVTPSYSQDYIQMMAS